MPTLKITGNAYFILSRARQPKQSDKILPSGDVVIEISEQKLADLQVIAAGRKLNRRTASEAIYYIAHHQRLMTTAEFKLTWGNP